ncbi:hypothetical protein CIB84_001393 [Bambusicola thoracicus]|uniref:Uncharacterized protein n=1 Tax=Bambusicola thoracicus TaxID=9083 RepID=A0A2P4TER6_BAMTH|nr:hypothetical protein CIB84_001393 [Bambusicola thoracicus]
MENEFGGLKEATFRGLEEQAKKIMSAIEVNLQKALAEASETCTQECLILGHSDNCWMPPSLTQYQQSNTPLPSFGFQQSWGRGARSDGRHTLGRPLPKDDTDKGQGGPRPQFYNTCERHCTSEDPVKVIPLANFAMSHQAAVSGSSTTFIHEHQL